jgi:ankyrin repeat protein
VVFEAMPSINSLPNELLSFVIDNLDSVADVASFARTNRRLYYAANPVLYKTAIARGNIWPLAYGARHGAAGTVRNMIAAGADPNFRFDETTLVRDWEKMTMPRRPAPRPARVPLPAPPAHHLAFDVDEFDLDEFDAALHGDEWPMSSMDTWGFGYYDDFPSSADVTEDELEGLEEEDESMFDSDADSSTLGNSARGRDEERPNVTPSYRHFTALHLAAKGGYNDVIEVLLEQGASINACSRHLCCCRRAVGLLNDLESPEQEGSKPMWTPLHMAICSSHTETAKLLLSRGADCKMEWRGERDGSVSPAQQQYNSTALHHAAGLGQVELVKHLVEKGYQTDLEVRDRRSLTPFYYAYANKRWDSTIPLLKEMGADINVEIKFYQPYCSITPLGEAVRLGNFQVAQKLLDLGVDPSHGFVATGAGHRKGLSPLHLGCMRSARPPSNIRYVDDIMDEDKAAERMSIMDVFIARGADVHATDCNGDTPLIAAAMYRVLPAVKALIKAGADVNARTALGRTVAMQAVTGPSPPTHAAGVLDGEPVADTARILSEILGELFRAGARLDDTDPHGNNVFHVLLGSEPMRRGATEYLRVLLNRAGASTLLKVKNKEGHTPFQVAFYNKAWTACDTILRQQRVRERFSPSEFRKMFDFATEAVAGGYNMDGLNLVLDLDIDRLILDDAAFFTELTEQCTWDDRSRAGADPARWVIEAIISRGLPPLSKDTCTRLLRKTLTVGWHNFAYRLIDSGADVNAVEGDGTATPLNLTIQTFVALNGPSRLKILLKVLLDRGANIHDSPCGCGGPCARPLNRAIITNNERFVLMMLASQPLSSDPRAKGGCYLHHALRFEETVTTPRIIDKLLSSGADVAELDQDDNYPVSVLLQTLIEQPYEVPNYQRFLYSLLHRGAKAGVDVNKPNKEDESIASLLQTLLDNKHAKSFVSTRLALVDTDDGRKEIRFLEGQSTTKGWKLLKDLQYTEPGVL